MKSFPATEVAEDRASVETDVMITMCGDHLVVRPPGQLDVEATEALVAAVACAVHSGFEVMLGLDEELDADDPPPRPRANAAVAGEGVDDDGLVSVLRAGYVRLDGHQTRWTIDLDRGRLHRSAVPLEQHAVPSDGWTDIRAVWASLAGVTALADDGTYVSTASTWATTWPAPGEFCRSSG